MWFDPDVKRLNYDDHGRLLGEFNEDDSILVVLDNGDFYLSNFDVNNHYEDNIKIIEKYDEHKVWTAVLYDADQQGYPYLKRFMLEGSKRKQNYLGENPDTRLVCLTDGRALSALPYHLRRRRRIPRFDRNRRRRLCRRKGLQGQGQAPQHVDRGQHRTDRVAEACRRRC